MKKEWLEHLVGKRTIAEIENPDVKARAQEYEDQLAKNNRDHLLIMLGYNQAMLDYGDLSLAEQSRQERIIADLKERLEM